MHSDIIDVCAGHGTKLERCKSSYQVFAQNRRLGEGQGRWLEEAHAKLRGVTRMPGGV